MFQTVSPFSSLGKYYSCIFLPFLLFQQVNIYLLLKAHFCNMPTICKVCQILLSKECSYGFVRWQDNWRCVVSILKHVAELFIIGNSFRPSVKQEIKMWKLMKNVLFHFILFPPKYAWTFQKVHERTVYILLNFIPHENSNLKCLCLATNQATVFSLH